MSAIVQDPFPCLVAPGFGRVQEIFAACLADRPDAGAALCVYLKGRTVVDLWGGPSYRADSLQLLYSGTKGALAVCLSILVERGLLDPDAPVSSYWPEFGAAGKAAVSVRVLMSHQAGLPSVDRGFSLEECLTHDDLAVRLAQQAPFWEPGTAVGYHGVTIGTLGRELVQRITGLTTSEFFRREVAERLGLDFWIGLPREHHARVAQVQPARNPSMRAEVAALAAQPDSLLSLSLPRGVDPVALDMPQVWAADLPSASGVADARSLARMYAACIGSVDGVQLLSSATLRRVTNCPAEGIDLVNLEPVRFAMGFQLPFPRLPYAGPGSFGHDGHNGTLGLAHPELGLAVGFTTDRQPDYGGADPFALTLVDAVLECL